MLHKIGGIMDELNLMLCYGFYSDEQLHSHYQCTVESSGYQDGQSISVGIILSEICQQPTMETDLIVSGNCGNVSKKIERVLALLYT